ncbi:hypothetical protein ACLI4R_14450 [Natrialbaceae archaeon A-chndr2]
MSYRKGPSENSLTLNTTHQMLRYFEDNNKTRFKHLVAFSPTRKWENVSGYDVHIPFLKTTVFQYKRPKVPDNGKPVSNLERRFSLNADQWLTLLLLFDRGQAFFTLPDVMRNDDLTHSLKSTVFVDVYGVLPDTSLAYVNRNSMQTTFSSSVSLLKTTPPQGKIRNGSKYRFHPNHVYDWREMYDGINNCNLGLRLGNVEERTEAYQTFTDRVERLSELDEGWMKDRLKHILHQQEEEYRNLENQGEDDEIVDYQWAMDLIEENVKEFAESKTDPSTAQLKRSKVNIFGK